MFIQVWRLTPNLEITMTALIQQRRFDDQQLSDAGLRAFFNIAKEWSLTVSQECMLLGGISSSTRHNWKVGKHGALARDQLERVSLILGIYKGLKLLFAGDGDSMRWLKACNEDRPFGGASPLDHMLRGSIDDLYAVRRYIDAWRGVWP
jgi:hypothetical protein